MIKYQFLISTIDDIVDKLDLRVRYYQVGVHLHDTFKTAFRTHNGRYEYLVMLFGLCNAPPTFKTIMNFIFVHKFENLY